MWQLRDRWAVDTGLVMLQRKREHFIFRGGKNE
jgi:hypothetical protein